MSKTCMQEVVDARTHLRVMRRRAHILPDATLDPNNGYACCAACGLEVYIGSGLHPNLGVPIAQVVREAAFLRRMK